MPTPYWVCSTFVLASPLQALQHSMLCTSKLTQRHKKGFSFLVKKSDCLLEILFVNVILSVLHICISISVASVEVMHLRIATYCNMDWSGGIRHSNMLLRCTCNILITHTPLAHSHITLTALLSLTHAAPIHQSLTHSQISNQITHTPIAHSNTDDNTPSTPFTTNLGRCRTSAPRLALHADPIFDNYLLQRYLYLNSFYVWM